MTEKILGYQVVSAGPAEVADEMVRWILDGEGCQTFACINPHPYVGALAGPRVSAALAGILPDPAPGMSACRPPFPPMYTPEQSAAIHAAIREARPDVLWVGMTAPKQELWLQENRADLQVKFAGAVGAVFDFYIGRIRRSGPIFLKHGLEWLPRLLQEPRRLWRRMFVSAPVFMWHVLLARLGVRPQQGGGELG
ncbi:MAG: WecB/TagA/CpsF family glycosyltransferase [Deltaproteobacteria bacterium]|nr:WecB/TagA/CpsF family glycosyltransferase [Deltaproteobacteria bacterium]